MLSPHAREVLAGILALVFVYVLLAVVLRWGERTAPDDADREW